MSDEKTEAVEQRATAEAPASGPEVSPAPEPEAPVAPEPETPAPVVRRQSVVMHTGSCDMRLGTGALDQLGNAARIAAGKPNRALLVSGGDVDAELTERCRRLLVDAGFTVSLTTVPAERTARSLENVTTLYETLAAEHVTADDPIVVIGDADVISLAIFAGATWHTGCPVVAAATTLDAVTDVTVTPRAIDAPGAPNMLVARGNARFMIADPSVFVSHDLTNAELMGRATMVAGAVAAGENSFNELAVRADGVIDAAEDTLVAAILDITKARARVVSSSALAMRQGILYGQAIGRALERALELQQADLSRYLVDDKPGSARLFAEGLRIAARLAAAKQAPEDKLVDFVFTQDGLLEKLGLSEVACVVDPQVLLDCLKAEEFSRSNRFMLALPLGFGRVRLTSVPDEMLLEHLSGWCKSRRKLARRRAREVAAQQGVQESN